MNSLLWKLLPYLRPYKWRILWAFIQIFLVAGFELLKPWPLQLVIDDVLGGKQTGFPFLSQLGPLDLLLAAAIGLVVISLGSAGVTWLHNVTTIAVGQGMVNDLRGALYAHLQRLSLAFHSRQKVGDLMYRITADSFAVQTVIMNGLLPIISAVVLLGGMLFVMIPLDPILTLVSLTVVPALFVLIAIFNSKIVAVATEVRDRDSHVYTLVHWAMSSIKVVQAFTKEEEEYRRFMSASRASLNATLRLYSWQTLYSGMVGLADRRRHRARHLCRRALGDGPQPDHRPTHRLHLLSRAALQPGEPDHAELGPDRRRAGRRTALFRSARHRTRSQRRQPQLSGRGRARSKSNGAMFASAIATRCRCSTASAST